MMRMTLLIGLVAAFSAAAGQLLPLYGVARAGDGDSLEINGTRIRLFGIDAPEFDQTCSRNGAQYACGAEAADQLSRLVTGHDVRCVSIGVDQYQRVVARCTVGATNINQTMVERGYAVAFRKYSTEYVAAEGRAKAAK